MKFKSKEVNDMKCPKLVVASDGHRTVVLLDGVLLGSGIEGVDFSTANENGEIKPTIRLLGIDVAAVEIDKSPDMEHVLTALAEE